MSDDQHFYIALDLKDGQIVGHSAALEEKDLEASNDVSQEPTKKDAGADKSIGDPKTFDHVFRSFASVVVTYRNFLQFTLAIAPMVSMLLAERSIGNFAKTKG